VSSDASDPTAWATALIDRHLRDYSTSEFLKAARALSTRYVERRGELDRRSALDSAGKRAAFAVLFGPIHYATVAGIVEALDLPVELERVVDLGCGTGAASAAWARHRPGDVEIQGIDRSRWALSEARWTWRTLHVQGRTVHGDLVAAASALANRSRGRLDTTGVLTAWAVNELPRGARDELAATLMALGARGATLLVVEPLSTRVAPWWDEWTQAFAAAGGRADVWHLPNRLPDPLRRLDRDAGFDRDELGARSLTLYAVKNR
jgi:hypothetical protein